MTKEVLTVVEMQQQVDHYIQQFKVGYFPPMTQLVRLTEELGELAREVNHAFGEKQKKETEKHNSVAEELGDVLIVLIMMANSLSLDLSSIFQENMNKFNTRDFKRFERKDGK